MKEICRVLIPEDVCDYIRVLVYEVEGLRVLNCQIIRSGSDFDKSTYTKFLADYKEATNKMNIGFDELYKEFIPEYLDIVYHKQVSFLTSEIVVSEVIE